MNVNNDIFLSFLCMTWICLFVIIYSDKNPLSNTKWSSYVISSYKVNISHFPPILCLKFVYAKHTA